ncbi:DNA repair protein rhp26 [Xanthoria calcicola]
MAHDSEEAGEGQQLPDAPTTASSPSDPADIDVHGEDEATRLRALAADVRDQDDLERDVGRQADQLLTEQANERDQKRLDKTMSDKEKLDAQIRKLRERCNRPAGSATIARTQAEIQHMEAMNKSLDKDLEEIRQRMAQRANENSLQDGPSTEESGNRKLPNESQREFLIRTGKITPFSKLPGRSLGRSESTLQDVLLDAEEGDAQEDQEFEGEDQQEPADELSHRNLVQPGFIDYEPSEAASEATEITERPSKRRRHEDDTHHQTPDVGTTRTASGKEKEDSDQEDSHDASVLDLTDGDSGGLGGSEEGSDAGSAYELATTPSSRRMGKSGKRKRAKRSFQPDDLSGLDDGNEKLYQSRLDSWVHRRSAARNGAMAKTSRNDQVDTSAPDTDIKAEPEPDEAIPSVSQNAEEWHLPHPTRPDTEIEGGYRIPGDIYPSLFNYQKTGVQWLWELYSQQVGGIVGDEMGLGKTIQIIAFLAGLHYCKKLSRPVIVVAPATVMKQWVNEFHTWWPPFRVSILHTSGSGMIDMGRESQWEEDLLSQAPSGRRNPGTKNQKAAKRIVERVVNEGHVLVTTYTGMQTYAELLIPVEWEYAVLDEGHKIRNPNTAITIYCKELRTANRVILSGTPMQNNLVELWSLFDFVFPMRLGTLVNFRSQFEIPIRQGGYANASNLQVQTAMKCAETLKDTISPYLLQRFKIDVASDLPKKTEQVLFCKLTRPQREAYEGFLSSDDLKSIMNGKRQVLFGIDILRKICNHPDLQDHRHLSVKPGYNYGAGTKSGKMQVVKALLELWKDQGHKTLLFAQHRIMLDILEKFIRSLGGFNFRRMDGNTPIHARQGMVDEFNGNPDAHVFLLTTKVGGLGINLTGANRVIIYDPDWNPSTDVQARERAWRLGQKREVMIYRLMTAGTIEEKIYHRQLFKQFLTNKILKDPKQRQTFQMQDLHDLFTLGDANQGSTETSELFKGTEVRFNKEAAAGAVAEELPQGPTSTEAPRRNGSVDEGNSVRRMAGVASLEHFQGEEGEDVPPVDSGRATNSEARVMEGIFARAGVHSALEHDQIINGKRVVAADPQMIEREARKVAAQAAKELKKAGEVARSVPVGTPTWTGQFGRAGRPEEQAMQRGFGRGRGGPASSSILAGLQQRQLGQGAAGANGTNGAGGRNSGQGSPGARGSNFMRMIRDYLMAHGGKVYTQMLIDHFNRYCSSAETTMEFKEMLKQIATLEKGSRGRGSWVLKDEYKATGSI